MLETRAVPTVTIADPGSQASAEGDVVQLDWTSPRTVDTQLRV
jgi:hypothetical protein